MLGKVFDKTPRIVRYQGVGYLENFCKRGVVFAFLLWAFFAFPQSNPSCDRLLSKPLESYLRYAVVDQNDRLLGGKLKILGESLWFFPDFEEPFLIASSDGRAVLEFYVSLAREAFVIHCTPQ